MTCVVTTIVVQVVVTSVVVLATKDIVIHAKFFKSLIEVRMLGYIKMMPDRSESFFNGR